MTNRIKAVFEQGVFKPVEAVKLPEGTPVELEYAEEPPLLPPGALVAALGEIAKLPLEGPQDGFSGADHDRILYGSKEGDAW